MYRMYRMYRKVEKGRENKTKKRIGIIIFLMIIRFLVIINKIEINEEKL